MGELGTSMSDDSARKTIFETFKEHNSGTRVSTELTVLETIRATYPDSHVTRTVPSKCDLQGYAQAGLATLTEANDELYDSSRHYQPPPSRLEDKSGHLKDSIQFAQWQYDWKAHTFIVYRVEYIDHYMRPNPLLFILYPKDLVTKGQVSPIDQLLLTVGAWSTDLHSEIYVFDDSQWTKDKELWKSVQGSSWDDVILNSHMKANLIADVQGFFDNRSLYKKLAVPWKRGLILHGVPGNGKTISIKALIASLSARDDPVPSLYVRSFDNQCNGEKYSIRAIFDQARKSSPCLLIFEDLDSLVTDATRSYFLNQVDGLESNDGILMIGSTNHLENLDPAISKRPSRFDRKYHFKLPIENERVAYARFWRSKLLDNDMVEFPEELCIVIGVLTVGFSFAYMKELFIVTLLTVARGGIVEQEVDESPLASNSDDGKNSNADAPVMVEHESVIVQESGNQEVATAVVEKTEERPAKRGVPDVEISDELKRNLLFKVILSEIKTLIAEMNSTSEEHWPSERKKVGGGGLTMQKARMPNFAALPMLTQRAT